MSTRPQEIVETVGELDDLAQVHNFLTAHDRARGLEARPAYRLSGIDEHDSVELTESLHEVLKAAVDALRRGQSVSILSKDREISTQVAAEVLGVSRPTVVKLIGSGELPAQVPGVSRRKLRLVDVLAYRDMLSARRNTYLDAAVAADGDVDAGELEELLREARRRA
ncbi:excisionase family DNA-binding protein [Pseudactinotalea terrae]|uniref:excisionase family DNA-binding protein n=1 Tax=Pseudactinotalea terrae TaxID=1743262 RepID=UPI0012E2D841|nr:excisionase family DNA-binding protein [Pseudactinotalea terrae]